MKFNIGIEDLAANVLIVMLKQNANNRFVSYSKMNEYGLNVIRILKEDGDNGIFIFSRNNVTAVLNDYSDFFIEKEENGNQGLYLNDKKRMEDLQMLVDTAFQIK